MESTIKHKIGQVQQQDLSGKADIASPTFTGTPTAPTATAGTNTTQIATTAFVQSASTANIAQTITNGVTASAPSQDAVFDALSAKQENISLTTTGTGVSTLIGNTLNIPNYNANAVLLAGNQNISGTKTFDNIGTLLNVVLSNGNTNLVSSALRVNTGGGYGIHLEGNGVGTGIYANNTSTGLNYAGANSGVVTFSVNKTGDVSANSFIKTGGTSSQFLKADGGVDSSAYAPVASPTLTGTPTAPTATVGTNTTQLATTAFVQTANSGNVKLTGNQYGISGEKQFSQIVNSPLFSNMLSQITLYVEQLSTATTVGVYLETASATLPTIRLKNSSGNRVIDFGTEGNNGYITNDATLVGKVVANGVIRLKNYTVATLPAGVQGDTAYVTNALSPSYLATVIGGGTVVAPVFYNGTTWVAH